jgi:hypothetical protein
VLIASRANREGINLLWFLVNPSRVGCKLALQSFRLLAQYVSMSRVVFFWRVINGYAVGTCKTRCETN